MSYPQRRVDSRLKVTIRARLRDSGRDRDACILDVSGRGLLATTAMPPRRGEFVEIMLGPASLVGQVRWSGERRFGIVLQDRLDVGAIARGDFVNWRAKFAPRRAASLPSPTALALESGRRARQVNLCCAIAAILVAALFLAATVRDRLGALQYASQAMSSVRDANAGR